MRILTLIFTLAFFCFVVSGCFDNDKNPTGVDNKKNGKLNATLSGDINLNFQCNEAFGLQAIGNASEGTSGLMQIQGTIKQGSDEIGIDIQVYHDPATGTYQLFFPPQEGVGTVIKNNESYISKSGSIAFTEVNKNRMVGTFSFTAFRMIGVGQEVTVTVTSGSFDVPVIESN